MQGGGGGGSRDGRGHKQDSGQWLLRGHAELSLVGGGWPVGTQSDEDLMISSFVAIDSRVNGLHGGCFPNTQQISSSVPDENATDQ